MENDLMEIAKRFNQLKSDFGGYTGEFLVNHIIDVISDELLSELRLPELDPTEEKEIKKALVNMFHLGQSVK